MTPELIVEIGADIDRLRRDLRNARNDISGFAGTVDKQTQFMKVALEGAFSGLATYFSISAISNFTRQVLDMTGQFQKFQAVLTNTLGSSAIAKLKLDELNKFAASTPFGVRELTDAFIKLANQGFKPTTEQVRQLGDLAASTGKSFDQLAEAIIDAQVGEYERLKEFGIRAKDAGDQVIFTFKGVSTEVDKTAGSIRNYITNLGDAEGVTGSMAAISKTLEGQVSNLGDSWDNMLVSIGNNTQGVFSKTISLLNGLINKITEYNHQLEIASKYKIPSNFWQELKRAFIGGGLTDEEKAVGAILNQQDATNAYVQEVIAGAKKTEDFDKAIKKLWDDIANVRASGKAQTTINGMVDVINQGVKALVDAQKTFGKVEENANFGNGKTTKNPLESLSDIINRSNNSANISGLQGNDTDVERIRQQYADMYNDIDRLAAESAKNGVNIRKQAEAAKFVIAQNEAREQLQVALSEEQRVINEVNRIRAQAGIKSAQNRERDLADLKSWYDNEVRLAKGNSDILAAIKEAYKAREHAIDLKWEQKKADTSFRYSKKLSESTSQTMLRQLNENTKKQLDQLQKEFKTAKEYNDKKLALQEDYWRRLDAISRIQQLEQLSVQLGDAVGNVFQDILNNGTNVFQALASEFKRMIVRMVADAAAIKVTNWIGGLLGIGKVVAGGGGIGSLLGGLLGGGSVLAMAAPAPTGTPNVNISNSSPSGKMTVQVEGKIKNNVISLSNQRAQSKSLGGR